jgi:PAS domain S-box-containing protein
MLDSQIVGIYLVILSLILTVFFTYLYLKDKDKRKLVFIITFFFVILGQIPLIIPRWHELQILPNLHIWIGLPSILGLFIVSLSSIFREKDFKKSFNLFAIITSITVLIIILPFQIDLNNYAIYTGLSIAMIFSSLFMVLKSRNLPNLMFLFMIIFYDLSEIALNVLMLDPEFIILSFTCAHIFMSLVFLTAKSSDDQGITSFFGSNNELERTKRQLELSQKRLVHVENIFDASPDPIVVTDLTGKIVECNNATLTLLGLEKKEDLMGKFYSDFITERGLQNVNGTLQSISETNSARTFEIVAGDNAGKEFPVEISTSVIKDSQSNSTGFVSIVKDITQRKMMEKQLKNYSDHLEKLVDKRTKALKESQEQLLKSKQLAAVGQAATMVGHDLRNPLQAIENGVFYIENDLSNHQLSEKAKETFERIQHSIEYADNIVNNLQSFTAQRKPMLLETPLGTIIEDFLLIFKKSDNIEVIIESEELPKIVVDKEMIERVFVNLANNGLHAMKNTGGTLKISVKTTKELVKVSFTDTGVGIPKDNLKKIFTPFFTTKAQGMGLGLAICKRIVEKHEGSIAVESKIGEGSTFTVILPIHRKGGGKLD